MIIQEDEEYKPKVTLQQKNTKDSIGYDKANSTKPDFQNAVQNSVSNTIKTGNELIDCINGFTAILGDKTLTELKHPLKSKNEDVALTDLLNMIKKINFDALTSELNDPSVMDSGTLAAIAVLFKIIIKYRDRMNKQDYIISELTRDLNSIKKDLGIA